MFKYIIGILVKELIGAVTKAVTDYLKLKKKQKVDKKKAKVILSEKDPIKRAQSIGDFLNG